VIDGERDGGGRYLQFDRDEWSRLRAATPLTLNEADIADLRGINDQLSLTEVEEIYLPLSRLLNLYVGATQALTQATDIFLGKPDSQVPYVIGIAGSVAVGKSTIARVLQALLSRWPDHPRVELVTTDGFLFPNRVLEERGLMARKGFPESYDQRRLLQFITDVKAGEPAVSAPVYSHLSYDIVPGEERLVRRPDIVVFEGLTILQTGDGEGQAPRMFVSDFLDFSIYLDAPEALLESWYVERFLTLRDTVFQRDASYFRGYGRLDDAEARATALELWQGINLPNLRQNIVPTRERARLILEKGEGHSVERVRLLKL
jgi:type I pantothenate kinase